MLNAIEAYTEHRPEITSRAINLLFDIARIERCSQLLRALKVSPKPGGREGFQASVCPHLEGAGLGRAMCPEPLSRLYTSAPSPGYRKSYPPNPTPTP